MTVGRQFFGGAVLHFFPYVSASPDTLLTCKCYGSSPVEIKCPCTIHNESVIDGASQCNFLVKINDLYIFQLRI